MFPCVIITRSDRGLDPFGSAEECLCLFVLHILKCLFVSLLEGPWEKRIVEVCCRAIRHKGPALLPLYLHMQKKKKISNRVKPEEKKCATTLLSKV